MLGRDPEQHHSPRLAWGRLIEALATAGLNVSEEELIQVPLTMGLDDEGRAALEAPRERS